MSSPALSLWWLPTASGLRLLLTLDLRGILSLA